MTYNNNLLQQVVSEQTHPLLFTTISGAHLYGFPSTNSDYDLRGVHILPVEQVIGLFDPIETIEVSEVREGLEIDLVTHDIYKFFSLLLKRNGYVLEQIYSPLVVYTTSEYDELKHIAGNCITRHHVHHYLGFAKTQWVLFNKEQPRRIKPLLYVYRVLLTGIHLMQSGRVEATLVTLNADFKLSYISDLIERKLAGIEHETLPDGDINLYQSEYERLLQLLETASELSSLPEAPTGKGELNDLLLRVRLGR